MKLKPLQAREVHADAVRDGAWFWDEVKPENYGEELRTCAAGKAEVCLCCTAAPNHKLSCTMLPCSFAYECVPTREAVRVKEQPSEGLANLAE